MIQLALIITGACLACLIAGAWIGFLHGASTLTNPEGHISTDRFGKIFMHTIWRRGHDHFQVDNVSVALVDSGAFDQQFELEYKQGPHISTWVIVKK